MSDSCSICGLILAPQGSDYPKWCKDLRALCWVEGRPVLSGQGHNDEDAIPFLLPVPTLNRFYTRRTSDMKEASCYPFHAACWTILEEVASKNFLVDSIEPLFKIFEGCHYFRDARALSWGHNYYLEDILDSGYNKHQAHSQLDFVAARQDNSTILADPLRFDFKDVPSALNSQPEDKDQSHSQLDLVAAHKDNSCTLADPQLVDVKDDVPSPTNPKLLSLPTETIHSIMYLLPFSDNSHLLEACNQDLHYLPSKFWESRFHIYNETGFARSIRPPKYSWKDWFFRIQFEMSSGLLQMNLRNRKRIWRLGVDLVDLIQTNKDPWRVLHGEPDIRILGQRPCSTVSCLALQYDIGGCRELSQRSVYWGERPAESQLYAVTPSYVYVLNRRLISGFTFTFSSGPSVGIGYIVARNEHLTPSALPKFLWIVASPLGIEKIAVDVYPHSFLDGSRRVAVSKWTLEHLTGISLGLDAIRIVSIWPNFRKHDLVLDDILWAPPYPSPIPSMLDDDIIALHDLQSKSFAPASTLFIRPNNGRLVAIKVYAPLGHCTGITGVRFVYNIGMESMWGSDCDAASLSFFLHDLEHLVNVRVYKIGSLVCHLQFTTNLNRTSEILPRLPIKPDVSFDCVEYRALNGGYILGFCGCFVGSAQELNCFGVIPTTTVASSKSTWSRPANSALDLFDALTPELPLGGIRKHGEFKSRLLLDRRLQSVQASVNTVLTKYRRIGQVTGLLFRSEDSSYPKLLGQLTGTGETYDLEQDEWIVDLNVTTTKPLGKLIRPGLSQIEGITIVTNRRRIEWGSQIVQPVYNISNTGQKVSEITWEFNAIFDRVQWDYRTD